MTSLEENNHNRQVNDSLSNLPTTSSETKAGTESLSFAGFVFCEKDLEQEHLVHYSLLDIEKQLPETVNLYCNDYKISWSAVKEFFRVIEPIAHSNCMESYYRRLRKDSSYQHMIYWDRTSHNTHNFKQATKITELETQLSDLEQCSNSLFQSSSSQVNHYFQLIKSKHRYRHHYHSAGELKPYPREGFSLLVTREQELEKALSLGDNDTTLRSLKKEIRRLRDRIVFELSLQETQIVISESINEICTRQLIALWHLYYDEPYHSKKLIDLTMQNKYLQEQGSIVLTNLSSEVAFIKEVSSSVKWWLVVLSIPLLISICAHLWLSFWTLDEQTKTKKKVTLFNRKEGTTLTGK